MTPIHNRLCKYRLSGSYRICRSTFRYDGLIEVYLKYYLLMFSLRVEGCTAGRIREDGAQEFTEQRLLQYILKMYPAAEMSIYSNTHLYLLAAKARVESLYSAFVKEFETFTCYSRSFEHECLAEMYILWRKNASGNAKSLSKKP